MIRSLALAALLALSAAASAAPVTRLPAAFQGDNVYLKVSLNGAAPVWMKFDVGASSSLLAGTAQPRQARVTAGPVALQDVRFKPSAMAGLAPDGTPLAGRLGEDCLGDRVLIIRTRQHEVWLSPPIDTASVPLPRPEHPAAGHRAPALVASNTR